MLFLTTVLHFMYCAMGVDSVGGRAYFNAYG